MKTSQNKASDFFNKGKLLLLLTGLFLITENSFCQESYSNQKAHFGIEISSTITANGYGIQYSPMISYKGERSSCYFGPMIQKQKMNLSGVQFNYDYVIVGNNVQGIEMYNSNLEVFLFCTTAYNKNAILGKRALQEEGMANDKYSGDFSKLRFQSVEAHAGMGLKITLFNNLQWINCIGVGGYTSFNFPNNLYYCSNNVGLLLRTGISFDLKK